MWSFEHTETTDATPAQIWQTWAAVSEWPRQNETLTSSTLVGPFAKGSKIELQPKKGPRSTIELIEATEDRSFTGRGKIPLGELRIEHLVEPHGAGARFTHRIVLTGPMRAVFVKLFAQKMADALPGMMRNIARMALEKK